MYTSKFAYHKRKRVYHTPQLRAKHRQLVTEALGDGAFVPALAVLLEEGDTRTLCLTADLLSRLYSLCLSCGSGEAGLKFAWTGGSLLEFVMQGIRDARVVEICARLLGGAGVGSVGTTGGGGCRVVLPQVIMSLLCFVQTVLVFFPHAACDERGEQAGLGAPGEGGGNEAAIVDPLIEGLLSVVKQMDVVSFRAVCPHATCLAFAFPPARSIPPCVHARTCADTQSRAHEHARTHTRSLSHTHTHTNTNRQCSRTRRSMLQTS